METETTPKRIFEVARDLHVTTPEILDFLTRCEIEAPRRQMQPVTEEIHRLLLYRFDRAAFNIYALENHLGSEEMGRLNVLVSKAMPRHRRPAPTPRAATGVRPPVEQALSPEPPKTELAAPIMRKKPARSALRPERPGDVEIVRYYIDKTRRWPAKVEPVDTVPVVPEPEPAPAPVKVIEVAPPPPAYSPPIRLTNFDIELIRLIVALAPAAKETLLAGMR